MRPVPGSGAGFRHALARDAVLARLVPGQRAALAAQARDAPAGGGALAGDKEAALDALELAVDLARTHFPMLGCPDRLAAGVLTFASGLGPRPGR